MTKITHENLVKALVKQNLGQWKLSGTPQNEREFRNMFRKVMYEDINGQAVLSNNPDDFGITWTQLMSVLDKS
jgi:hypothetical protein|tara:strand:- start:1390 stop:1608 length:219 start_codon:yes stop_codon:yes gene_type:complete